MDFIKKIQEEMIKLQNERDAAEKKNLDYEMKIFNTNKEVGYIRDSLKNYKLKVKELELKNYELELNLREEKMKPQQKKNKTSTHQHLSESTLLSFVFYCFLFVLVAQCAPACPRI